MVYRNTNLSATAMAPIDASIGSMGTGAIIFVVGIAGTALQILIVFKPSHNRPYRSYAHGPEAVLGCSRRTAQDARH